MSALLQGVPPRDLGNRIDITDGTLAPDHYANGLPYEVDDTLAVDVDGVVDHFHQGLPFTAVGRLSMANVVPTYYGSGGAPFNALNQLCRVNGGVQDHYNSGVAFIATGRIRTI